MIKGTGCIQKIDMTLSFQAATNGTQGSRQVNFLGFCHLVLKFYKDKMVGQAGYVRSFSDFVIALL